MHNSTGKRWDIFPAFFLLFLIYRNSVNKLETVVLPRCNTGNHGAKAFHSGRERSYEFWKTNTFHIYQDFFVTGKSTLRRAIPGLQDNKRKNRQNLHLPELTVYDQGLILLRPCFISLFCWRGWNSIRNKNQTMFKLQPSFLCAAWWGCWCLQLQGLLRGLPAG